jgi:hypothetical protein
MPIHVNTKVRGDFQAAAKDGKISGAEANGLITKVRAGKLTESEANAFKQAADQFKDTFSPEAKQTIDKFINGTMKNIEVLDPGPKPNPGGLADPAVLKGDKDKLEQQAIAGGELFRNGVGGEDADQDYIGDCYLIASMSSIAQANPKAIEDAFKQNANGTYTVRIYEQSASGKWVAQHVTIDGDLPRNSWTGNEYARGSDPKELWPALLEKAFAARAGGYGQIEAGVPGDAMSAITGKPSADIAMRGKGVTADGVFAQLQAAVKAGKPATAVTLGESSSAKYKGTNIYADHTYSVFGVTEEKGVKYVQLRNPWGESEPDGNGPDDGVFKLPLDRFMSLFCGATVNG